MEENTKEGIQEGKQDVEAIRQQITVRGLSGLNNLGNTCFMNSALQCLSASNFLTAYFLKKQFFEDLKGNIVDTLADQYRKKHNIPDEQDVDVFIKDIKKIYYLSATYNFYKLIKAMWNEGNSTVTPSTFKQAIGYHNRMFMGFRQHDSQEFVNFILDQIHEETKVSCDISFKNVPDRIKDYLKLRQKYTIEIKKITEEDTNDTSILDNIIKEFDEFTNSNKQEELIYKYLKFWQNYIKNNYSIIQDIFAGAYLNEITCKECGNKSHTFDPFTSFTLDLPTDQNEISLEDCLKNYSKPELLTGDNQYNCDKCKKKVDANKNMFLWEIPDYFVVHLKRFKNNGMLTSKNDIKVNIPIEDINFGVVEHEYHSKKNTYELYGVIRQFGSLNGGHYIAITKNVMNNKWYEFNDSHVVHVPDNKIKEELSDSCNYILFYRKKSLKIIKNLGEEQIEDNDPNEDSEKVENNLNSNEIQISNI